MSNYTIFGQPVATLSDVANLVVGAFEGSSGFYRTTSTDPADIRAELDAATKKAMGPGADPLDVVRAQQLAWRQYQGDYQESLRQQAAGDVPISDALDLPSGPNLMLLGILAAAIAGVVLVQVGGVNS